MCDHGPWSDTEDVLQSGAPWTWLRQSKSSFYFLSTSSRRQAQASVRALRGCRLYSYGLVVRDGSRGSSARTSVLTGERVLGSNRKSSAYILLTRIRCFGLT